MKAKAGRVALFRGKIRERPLTVTLTPRHWALLDDAAERLQLTRADLVGLLIHKYARTVTLPARLRTDDTRDKDD
jgi:hypothetical protein